MGKINREELFKILDEQYTNCKAHILLQMEDRIKDLENFKGNVLDIQTEIIMGNDMEGTLFREKYTDYYDKEKLLSSESVPERVLKKVLDEDEIWKPVCKYKPTTATVTAPEHKKKYLIKLSDDLTHERAIEIAQEIEEQQFICYNKGTIEQIITLDVE